MKKCFYNINGKKFSKRIDAYREINEHYKGLNQQIVIKEGVSELFNENPELANIGTPEQYSQYLDTLTDEPIVYKGFRNKAGIVHNTPNHSYFTNSFKIADAWYKDEKGIKTFVIPKVQTEFFQADTSKGVTTIKPQEENYINNSKAGLIKLETNDIGGLQTQHVVNKKYQPLELGSKEDIEGFMGFIENNENTSTDLQAIMLHDNLLSSIESTTLSFSDEQLNVIMNAENKTEFLSELVDKISTINNKNADRDTRVKYMDEILNMLDENSLESIFNILDDYKIIYNNNSTDADVLVERMDNLNLSKLSKANPVDNLFYFLREADQKSEIYLEAYEALISYKEQQETTETQVEEEIINPATAEVITEERFPPEYVNGIAKKYGGNENINKVKSLLKSTLNNRYLPYGNGLSSSMKNNFYDAIYKIYEDMISGTIDNVNFSNMIIDIKRNGQNLEVETRDITLEDIINPENKWNTLSVLSYIMSNVVPDGYSFLNKEDRMNMDTAERNEIEREIEYFMTVAFPEISLNEVKRIVEGGQEATSKTKSRKFDEENIAPEKALNSVLKSILSTIPKNMTSLADNDFLHYGTVVGELNQFASIQKAGGYAFTLDEFVRYLEQASKVYTGYRGKNAKTMYDYFNGNFQVDKMGRMVAGIMRYQYTGDVLNFAKEKLSESELIAVEDNLSLKQESVAKLLSSLHLAFSGVVAHEAVVARKDGGLDFFDTAASTVSSERIKNPIKEYWGRDSFTKTYYNGKFSDTDVYTRLVSASERVELSKDGKTMSVIHDGKVYTLNIDETTLGELYSDDVTHNDIMTVVYNRLGFPKAGLMVNVKRNEQSVLDYMKNHMFAFVQMAYYNNEASLLIEDLKQEIAKYEKTDFEAIAQEEINFKEINKDKYKKLEDAEKSFLKLIQGELYMDYKYSDIQIYSPTNAKTFMADYITNVMSYESIGSRNMYEKADGSIESLYTTASPFSMFMEDSNAVGSSIWSGVSESVKKNNLILNKKIAFGKAKLIGGYSNKGIGKQQKDLSTPDMLDLIFNKYINERIQYGFKRRENNVAYPTNMVTISDINSDRGSIYMREYQTSNPLFKAEFENGKIKKLTPQKEAIVEYFTDIANYYNNLRSEAIETFKAYNIDYSIETGGLTFEGQQFTKNDKAIYNGLTEVYHIAFDKQGIAIPGNALTLNNLSFPPSLIETLLGNSKNKYKEIIKQFVSNEAVSLADMLIDANTSLSEFSSIIDLSKVNKIIDTVLKSENIAEAVKKATGKTLIGLKIRDENYIFRSLEDYNQAIVDIKALNAKFKDGEVTVEDQNNYNILQLKINYTKDIKREILQSKVSKKNSLTGSEVNPLLEYAILSFLFHNESISQLSRGTSLQNATLADYIKRGHGVTSPVKTFNTSDPNGIQESMNVIIVEDMPAQMLGKIDMEALSNGIVISSPLMWERMRYSAGMELGDIGYGNIKTNMYDAGIETGEAMYLKMSETTIKWDDIRSRSSFHMDLLRTFLDVNITDVENNNRNLYSEFKFEDKLRNVKNQKEYTKLINDYDAFMKEQALGTNFFYLQMPHKIAFRSAVKSFVRKVQDLDITSEDQVAFNYRIPKINVLDLPITDGTSMITVSTKNYGLQQNKQHDILGLKTLPTQILNIAASINMQLSDRIVNALSDLTDVKLTELEALASTPEKLIEKLKELAYASSLNSSPTMGKLEILSSKNTVTDVILKDINTRAMALFNKGVKPDMLGGTFVQEPAYYSVYEDIKDGTVHTARSLNLQDDSIEVEGYTRRKIKPLTFKIDGKELLTKEELLNALKKGKAIQVIAQEIIMDFPYREQFGIEPDQKLNDIVIVNGVSLKDNDSILSIETLNEKIKTIVNYNPSGLKGAMKSSYDSIAIDEIQEIFKNQKGVINLVNKFIKRTGNEKISIDKLFNEIAGYYRDLNSSLYTYAVRVPTTNMSSGFPSRIVEFANGSENIVKVPSEKSILDGSDYDIDELHIYYVPRNIGSNKNMVDVQRDMFSAIYEAYSSPDAIPYIIAEIDYKPFVEKADSMESVSSLIKRPNSFPNALVEREQQYDGKSMVGRLVTGQHALLSLISTNRKADIVNLIPALDNMNQDALMDLYAAYINMATDNSKLGGPLGKLGHNVSLSELALGIFIKGINQDGVSLLDSKSQSILLDNRLTEVLNHPIVKNALRLTQNSLGVSSNDFIELFQETFSGEYQRYVKNANKDKKNLNKEDILNAEEIKNALAVGIQAHRLYQFNLIQGVKSTPFETYNLRKKLEFNAGLPIASIINEKDLSTPDISYYEGKSMEKEIRETFNIVDFVRKNPHMMSQLKLFNYLESTVSNDSVILSNVDNVQTGLESIYGKTYSKKKLREEQFNAATRAIESLIVGRYFTNNQKKVQFPVSGFDAKQNKTNSISYRNLDLSKPTDVNTFLYLFSDFVKKLKSENKGRNMFLSNLISNGSTVRINYAERIDNSTLVDDYINSFNAIEEETTKDMFRIYSLLMNGMSDTQNSLSRFIDKSLVEEFSADIKRDKEKYTDFIKNELSKEKTIKLIALTDPSLQRKKYKEEEFGYKTNPSYNTHRSPSRLSDEDNNYFFNGTAYSKYLVPKMISNEKYLKALSTFDEVLLLSGQVIYRSLNNKYEVTDTINNTGSLALADGQTLAHTNTTSVTISPTKDAKGLSTGIYKITPVLANNESQIQINNTLKGLSSVVMGLNDFNLFSENVSGGKKFMMLPNGDMTISTSELYLKIEEVKGLFGNLNNNGNFVEVINKVNDFKNENIMKEAFMKYFGADTTMSDRNVISFFARNNTRQRIKNVINSTRLFNEKQVIDFMVQFITQDFIDNINNAIDKTKTAMIERLNINSFEKNILKDKIENLSLFDIAQSITDHQFSNGIELSFPALKPTKKAIASEKDANDKTPLICN